MAPNERTTVFALFDHDRPFTKSPPEARNDDLPNQHLPHFATSKRTRMRSEPVPVPDRAGMDLDLIVLARRFSG